MTTPKPLSPAAQAVFSAWQDSSDGHYSDGEWVPNVKEQLAAALRAAAGRVEDLNGDIGHPKFVEGVLTAAHFLDLIATELEGSNG
jgi:hypothetical protein